MGTLCTLCIILSWFVLVQIKDYYSKALEEAAADTARNVAIQKANRSGDAVASGSEEQQVPAEADPWEFVDPVDVIGKLPKDFYEQLESKKWSERKQPLDDLRNSLAANPRLDPKVHYGEIVSCLKNVSCLQCR